MNQSVYAVILLFLYLFLLVVPSEKFSTVGTIKVSVIKSIIIISFNRFPYKISSKSVQCSKRKDVSFALITLASIAMSLETSNSKN